MEKLAGCVFCHGSDEHVQCDVNKSGVYKIYCSQCEEDGSPSVSARNLVLAISMWNEFMAKYTEKLSNTWTELDTCFDDLEKENYEVEMEKAWESAEDR